MQDADVELTLRATGNAYTADMRFRPPDSPVDADLALAVPCALDLDALIAHSGDASAYGQALTAMLFADEQLRQAWAQVRSFLDGADTTVRLRLRFDARASELHRLHWELLQDPLDNDAPFLAMSERVLLSRYLASHGLTPITRRPRAVLRAVIVVANPRGLEEYGLAPVDVAGEIDRATAALGTIPATVLAAGEARAPVTLDGLLAALRDEPDIVYLVAHGTLRNDLPALWLEDANGAVARVAAAELVQRLEDLSYRPRLVVLASCQSSGAGVDDDALLAIGPQLAAVGVPAVIAMHGNVTMATVATFMPRLFAELQRHGEVDRALAAARIAVRDRPDWWLLTLFLRLRDGCIWERIAQVGEAAYDVRGLPNPYLGLRAFTYADRGGYAGRERVVEAAVDKLTMPGNQTTLLFITGASGSGKSSFAQAGLLPGLEAHYRQRGQEARWAVFRPSRMPLAGMLDALNQLGLPTTTLTPEIVISEPDQVARVITAKTPAHQINILVIDQFEEVFTQSDPTQRDGLIQLLGSLPDVANLRTHVIATMRSDYLPELFPYTELYDHAKQGIDLRAMSEEELQEAIQRPLQDLLEDLKRPPDEKRFEAALVQRLAHDAAGDPAYLPLLQVTLEDLWERGSLRLSAYTQTDAYSALAHALRGRAEQAYQKLVVDGQEQPRPEAERATIMQIFLDLVEVSLDSDVRRDVRRRRNYDDLVQGSTERERLVEQLCAARLLSRSVERRADGTVEQEVVDIIHEALIRTWERLREAMSEQRQVLQQRARFEQALHEWISHDRSDDYLLTGVRLAEARALNQRHDIALQNDDARTLLELSVARREAERQHELAQVQALADAQRERAEEQTRAAQRLRRLVAALAVSVVGLLLVGAAAGWAALYAREQQRYAAARELANAALINLRIDPERSTLLALEAITMTRPALPEAEDALHRAVQASRVQHTFTHAEPVYSVAFSPDGTLLASGNGDGSLQVWQPGFPGEPRMLFGHSKVVKGVAFSVDGRLLASASADGTAKIWDVASGQELHTLADGGAGLEAVAFSRDGRWLATAAQDAQARLWDVASGELVRTFAEHSDPVESVAFSPDSTLLVTGSGDMVAKIWNIQSGQVVRTLAGHVGGVYGVAFSPDGNLLATASRDGTAKVWDVSSGLVRLTMPNHNAWVTDIVFSADGTRLATASRDGTARLWDSSSGKEEAILFGHANIVEAVAFSADGTRIATASIDGTAKVWSATAPKELLSLSPRAQERHTREVTQIAYNRDGTRIATGSWDGTAKMWDATSGQLLFTLPQQADQIYGVTFNADGAVLATTCRDGTVKLWNAATGALVRTLPQDSDAVMNLAFSPDGAVLATVGWDQSLKIWNPATGQRVHHVSQAHERAIYGVAFSPDGKLVATGGWDGMVKIWDTTTAALRQTLPQPAGRINDVVFSPDGKLLAVAGDDRIARVWELASGEERWTFSTNTGVVTGVAFSRDGERLVTSSLDGVTRIWSLDSGQEWLTFEGVKTGYTRAVFNPDGTRLAAANEAYGVEVYALNVEQLIALAHTRVTRTLRPEECQKYLHRATCPSAP